MTQEEIESYIIEEINQYSKIVKLRTDCLSFIPVLNLVVKKLDVILAKRHYSEFCIFYQTIWDQVRSYYKQAEKLVPAVLYMFFKIKCINISPNKFIEVSNLTKRQFKIYFMEAVRYCPEYFSRDHIKMIQKLLLSVIVHFHFDREFIQVSDSLLRNLWNRLINTTDSIIAGIICVLTMVKLDVNSVNYSMVCRKLGIQMSSVFYQVKRSILSSETAEKFTGFKRSRDILKPLLT